MERDRDLPAGLCGPCTDSAVSAMQFIQTCQKSEYYWRRVVDKVSLTPAMMSDHDRSLYIYLNEDKNVLTDQLHAKNATIAADRLNSIADCDRKTKRKKGIKCPGLKCLDCGKEFSMPYYLNQHLRNTMKRVCTQCAKIVPRDKLGKHLMKIHGQVLYTCDKCYKLFDGTPQLEQHLIIYHSIIDCQCKICGQGFKNERSLRAHMYAHTLFNCASCNRGFENRKCFLHHQLKCKEKCSTSTPVYECHDCGNTYMKKPSLKMHIVSKHLNVSPYVCQVCGKRSATLAHNKAHEDIHKTERKVYQCYCGANLRTLVGFQMHQRIHSGEKPYECKHCGERFLSASRRLDHVKRRHWSAKEMMHKCNVDDVLSYPKGLCVNCSNIAISAYQFRMLVRKSENLWNNCINSLNAFPTFTPSRSVYALLKDNLALQTTSHFDGNAKDFLDHLMNRLIRKKDTERKQRQPRNGPNCVCVDCGKTFLSPYYLNMHLRNSGQKESCWSCGAMVIRGQEMKDHLSIIHKTETFLCQDCPMLFQSEVDLKKHSKKAHGPGVLTCSDCGRTFQRKASFDVHSQMHMVRTCRACGVQFTNRGCYREHRSKCEPDAKPDLKTVPRNRRSNVRDPATFTCDYCGKTYHSRPQLKNHILWIHMDIRPHQCQWCGKRFYTPARLVEHTVVHTRERNFECDICGAKLVSKMAAVYHRRRHTGERPYECEDCGEKFISSSRRSEHAKRRHNKGSRVPCKECSASFVRTHELRKHIEKAHNLNADQIFKVKKLKEIDPLYI